MVAQRVDALDLADKKVFCRVDFNVPLEGGKVADDTRIRAALRTIEHILKQGAKLVLGSHLGRPKGKVVDGLRMEPVGARLAELLGPKYQVIVADEVIGDGVRGIVAEMQKTDVVLLQNLRFDPREKSNDETLAKELAALVNVYVNDAFGTAHRAHASTAGMAAHVPERAAGFLLLDELASLGRLVDNVERPFVALLGGAKVSDKVGVLEHLIPKVDAILVGGAMANTFLKAKGVDVGSSKVEEESVATARNVLQQAAKKGVDVLLPVDVVVASGLDVPTGEVCDVLSIPQGMMALDIGPETRTAFGECLAGAQTIFWNGPMGVFEREPFAAGTMQIARAVAEADAFSVIGGGDSVSAVNRSGVAKQIGHISTGGGASLEFVEGKVLPGVAALEVEA
ncbi:MAG: phosphoglycerate kinase [Deltaproteobacteria bacterium]|nr:phosphoglycerate kinase [Deltaproteobacteria bacterium]